MTSPPWSDVSAEALRLDAVRALARASRLLERSSSELSLAHYRVLSAIASGDQRATRIAARLAIGKPAISAAVETLSQRGLLVRAGVAGDQRAAALHLTTEGDELLRRVEGEMTRRMADLCARVPDPRQMLESLVWLDAAIEAQHAGPAPTDAAIEARPAERAPEPAIAHPGERAAAQPADQP